MNIDWDPAKDRANQAKHGISFSEAKAVFDDPGRIDRFDNRDYDGEERWAAVGLVGRMLVYVIYTERAGGVRLISARKANDEDAEDYYANKIWQ
jgi:uncharacterized DUF497 family protein